MSSGSSLTKSRAELNSKQLKKIIMRCAIEDHWSSAPMDDGATETQVEKKKILILNELVLKLNTF